MRVAILGAGIAGLSVAHFVRREAARRTLPLDLTVYEAGPRAGGRIRTQEDAGYRVEWAANGIQGLDGAASKLADELGLASEKVVARPEAARRYILKGGRLHLLPLSPPALIGFGALSARGKLRLVAEPFFARRSPADETVHDFAARHMGEEAASTLIGTVVRGVFAGDARRLSLDASFPIMRDMERKHRSLVVAMIRGKRSPGGRTLWRLRGGIESLVRALAAEVPVAIASGALREEIEAILSAGGLREPFHAIVGARDVRQGKPHPEPYLTAARRLAERAPGLRPEDCVVFEDSMPGIAAARAAGMKVVAVTNSYPAAKLGAAHRVVDTLAGLDATSLRALFAA